MKKSFKIGSALLALGWTLPHIPSVSFPAMNGTALAAAAVPADSALSLKFEGNVTDSSSALTPVSAAGSPTYTAGRVGSAIEFKTAGQYLNLGKTANTTFGSATDYTVAFWMQSSGVTGDPVIIGNKNWASGANTGWIVSLQSNGSLKWNYTPSVQTRTDVTIPGVADGSWHYIAITHDRNGSAKFYKDAQMVSSVSIAAKQGSIDTTSNTNIGQDGTGAYGYALKAKLVDGTAVGLK
ncbi:hypothetical protein FHS18_000962 [Paenibacillus phyllosphaerae]|uniref:LamG domain-containing protein n=1 Tax=Paenibacillus phyllosphaerae TaxID=274593 RepID=A0A7W5FL70_9BACL|nr:LamG domain-containing protein [Paenibacillus phyllosphaerae]MBB3108910.1 hypothetical protein [Paenibacillus phyllosphaerae]